MLSCNISHVATLTFCWIFSDKKVWTSQLSILASAQSLGFILGPGIQAALTPLQCSDAAENAGDGEPYFSIDMYTVPGYVSGGGMTVPGSIRRRRKLPT